MGHDVGRLFDERKLSGEFWGLKGGIAAALDVMRIGQIADRIIGVTQHEEIVARPLFPDGLADGREQL